MKQIVKKIFLPSILLLFGELTSSAWEVIVDSIKYQVSDNCSVVGYVEGIKYAVIKDSVSGIAVTNINRYAFKDCTSLSSVAIPVGITSIGEYVFVGCTSLTSVVIPEGVTSIENHSFWGCTSLSSVVIPEGVTNIGQCAFHDCSSLTSIIIPEGVTCIRDATFSGCTSLVSVEISDGLTSIGGSSFSNCTSLTSVAIPYGLTSIGDGAFEDCASLTSIDIPDNLTSIGENAFDGCTSLTSVVIPEGITSIGEATFRDCTSLESVVIPKSVTCIGAKAFLLCTSLTSVVIPGCLTSIGDYCFDCCESLSSVVITNGVTSIGTWAFYGCSSLTSVIISDVLTSIGYNAFGGCYSLMYLTIRGQEMVSKDVFSDVLKYNPLVFVDEGLYDLYIKDSDWASYSANIISTEMLRQRTLELIADEGCSSLFTVLGDSSVYTANLKIKGSINGYDLMALRNKAFHLLYLDLSEADIVANDGGYEYYTGFSLQSDNVLGDRSFADLILREVVLPKSLKSIGNNAFSDCKYLEKVVIQDGLLSIGNDAFNNCKSLNEIHLPNSLVEIGSGAFYYCTKLSGVLRIPDKVKEINSRAFARTGIDSLIIGQDVTSIKGYRYSGQGAFSYCSNLRGVCFNRKLKTVGSYAFEECKNLTAANLPYTVENIENGAFSNCTSLESIKIPSMTKRIGNEAFSGCNNLRNVYTYTVEPTEINQQTFSSYKYATLNVPKTSANLYTYNTQWSQFAFVREFDEPYNAFYLNGDVELDDNTGRMSGEPDAEMYETSGFIVEGEETQELSDIYLLHNGKDGASVIGSSNLAAKSMKVNITVEGNRWYFFCFPFNVERDSIECTSDYILCSYNGLKRAGEGSGWIEIENSFTSLQKGLGYIFQASKTGVLSIHVGSEYLSFAANNESELLHAYESTDATNASWNFIGNPFISYYDVQDLAAEYDAPIIVWNGYSYDVYKPGDDEYQLKPFEAFFVQKTNTKSVVNFLPDNRITYNQGLERKALLAKQRAVMGTPISPDRQLVNITIMDKDSVTDRTRIVYSTKASMDYEIGVDASKFHADGVPQIYTLNSTTKYAINERPMADDDIHIGFIAPTPGVYTLSVPRNDTDIEIYDNFANSVVDLTFGNYSFESKAGTFNDRFVIHRTGGVTAVENGFRLDGMTVIAVDGGIDFEGKLTGKVSVYSESGMLLAEPIETGRVELGNGVYIIKIGERSVKMTLN